MYWIRPRSLIKAVAIQLMTDKKSAPKTDDQKPVTWNPTTMRPAMFSINPMMLTHADATATGVLVKGVDPRLSLGVASGPDEFADKFTGLEPVLDLPQYIIAGTIDGLRRHDAKPAESKFGPPPDLPPVPELPPGKTAKEALNEAIHEAASAATRDAPL